MSESKLQVFVEDDLHVRITWGEREALVFVSDGRLQAVIMAPGVDKMTAFEHKSSNGLVNTGTVICEPS